MKKKSILLSVLSLGLALSSQAALVAWYPLDSNANDASGNGYNGTVNGDGGPVNFGQAGANGNTGQSAAFSGNSRIDVPFNSALNPESFTVTLWANASSTANFASPITSRDDVGGGTSTHGYILYNDNGGNWNFWTGDGDPGWETMSGGAVTVSKWTHLALSFDASTDTKSLWIDGALAASVTAANQYSPNGTVEMENLHIGSGADLGDAFFFDGNIDDVAIWDESLDGAAIQSIMDNGVASVAIPEPSSLGLLGIAGLFLLRRRRS